MALVPPLIGPGERKRKIEGVANELSQIHMATKPHWTLKQGPRRILTRRTLGANIPMLSVREVVRFLNSHCGKEFWRVCRRSPVVQRQPYCMPSEQGPN